MFTIVKLEKYNKKVKEFHQKAFLSSVMILMFLVEGKRLALMKQAQCANANETVFFLVRLFAVVDWGENAFFILCLLCNSV